MPRSAFPPDRTAAAGHERKPPVGDDLMAKGDSLLHTPPPPREIASVAEMPDDGLPVSAGGKAYLEGLLAMPRRRGSG
jgi:hypothetical protein